MSKTSRLRSDVAKRKRDQARLKLAKFFSISDDEAFVQALWAVKAIHEGNLNAAARVLQFPQDVVDAKLGSRWRLPDWYAETLVNELLATPKRDQAGGQQVDFRTYSAIFAAHALLQGAEEADDAVTLSGKSVLDELPRIGRRQFPWQRGFDNKQHLYRSHSIYGGPKATAYFVGKFGLTPAEFALCGFVIWGVARGSPIVSPKQVLEELGLTQEIFSASLRRLSLDVPSARDLAKMLCRTEDHIAYRESVLRRYPVISFGGGYRLRAPIPELVLERVSGGLYYDLVSDVSGDVTQEIGAQFEDYVAAYFEHHVANVRCEAEFQVRSQTLSQRLSRHSFSCSRRDSDCRGM